MSDSLSTFELLDALDQAQRHAASIPGPAAWLISRLWLPDIEDARAALDKPGFETEAGEFVRAQALCAIDAIRERGNAWHAEQEPAKRPPVSPDQDLGAGNATDTYDMTRTEAADLLGITRQRVGQLAAKGALRGIKENGAWILDRSSVEARAERSSQ